MARIVFISYSSKDQEAAEQICSLLEDREVSCWIAPRDIQPGEMYAEEIPNAIDEAVGVVLVLSEHANKANQVRNEIEIAFSKGKRIFPVRIQEVEPSGALEFFVKVAQWVDAWQPPIEAKMDQLASAILSLPGDPPVPPAVRRRTSERFFDPKHWNQLEQIGKWSLNSEKGFLEGQGVNQFLLSKNVYGPESLTINAEIRFFDYEAFADEALDTANAGIVFGWEKQRYFHLLFDGTRLLLEEVGAQGGGHYHDLTHIHKGVEFEVKEGELYRVAMHVRALQLEVHVDNRFQFSADLPREAQGKVGLRPWRSRIECTFFEVSDE